MTSSEPGAPRTRRLVLIATALIAVALVARVVTSGQAAVDQGHQALQAGNELGATVAYREAISWYLPLVAPWRDQAADALWALHEQQLADSRLPDAVRSLQSLRAGLRSGDSLIRPDAALKARVDTTLAPLMARWELEDAQASGREPEGTLEARTTHHAALLAKDERPSRGWGLVAVLGFFLWVGGAIVGLRDDEGPRWRLLGLSAVGLVAMLAGVALA
ncbi:MAG: hypothetical protein QF464_07635 [Myxococcota bacterium]|nr:hypothetical protein [Myxococcota bacterium]